LWQDAYEIQERRMCGIAGIALTADSTLPDMRERLLAMGNAMLHRGPDDSGIYISPDGQVGLVNRRLAIRDLSPAGHMPMSNPAEDIWITYNGEIYNTDELRPELERLGHTFRSTSDTEVILRGYEAWGSAIVPRLRGMFALAIHDNRPQNAGAVRILIARDHIGIKPVYYCRTATAVVFASELKALLASGLVSRAIDPAGLVGYLLTGSVPNPHTIYRGVRGLEPAHYLAFDAAHANTEAPTQYWSLPTDCAEVTSLDDAAEQMRELLAEAVRIRLVSDVPLGAFLSGGLDSSSVVALMRQATDGPLRTCSMIFEEATYSEAPYARAVAQAVGAEHFERVITFEDVRREFDHIMSAMDQPTVDGVNTYFVSQTARQAGLTVALSGLGGDELFGGYRNTFQDTPRVLHALQWAQRVPGGSQLAHSATHLLPNRRRWARIQDALHRPASLASAYLTRRGLFSQSEVKRLVLPEIWAEAMAFEPLRHIAERADGHNGRNADVFAWISRAELRTYTHHQLLRDTDVMSMIHSLEVRVPLLDRALVEAALRLPTWTKTGDPERPKPLLARAMEPYLPEKVLARRDKQGFTFPFAEWLRGGLGEHMQQMTAQVKQSAYVAPAAIDAVIAQFQRGEIHWSRAWALVALASVFV